MEKRGRHLKIMEAKEKFVDELKRLRLDYLIVRPNGFFSDMKDFWTWLVKEKCTYLAMVSID